MRIAVRLSAIVIVAAVALVLVYTSDQVSEQNHFPESTPVGVVETPAQDEIADANSASDSSNSPDGANRLQDPRCEPGDTSQDTVLSGKLIILDPGHGGEDLGTVNTAFDLTESELVLPISEKLRDRLVASGAHVCLTRIDDAYIGLGARAEFANAMNGDAFVSIHLNSLPDPSENYTMAMWGNEAKDRFLAEKLLEQLRVEMALPEYHSGQPNPMNSDVYLLTDLDSNMLREARMPAVLVEASFLSNSWEARAFNDGVADGSHWREHQIVDALHTGLINYFAAFE